MKAIILAASRGTGMHSHTPKVLHKVLGTPMLYYTCETAKAAGAVETFIVAARAHHEAMHQVMGDDVFCVVEETQIGSAYALYAAQKKIPTEGQVLVLYADVPLITAQTITHLLQSHIQNQNDVTMFASDTGIYVFEAHVLREVLAQFKQDEKRAYYLSVTLEEMIGQGYKFGRLPLPETVEFTRVHTRSDLAVVTEHMKQRINARHMEHGVTLINPAHTYIGPKVEIGPDSIIYPGCILEGSTKIGNNCVIGSNSRIVDSQIAENVEIESSVILESQVGAFTAVGPFAYIRPHSTIGKHCKVGDFVEVKNAQIGDYTKASHLTYVGDADVGSHVNFGCGTVTVNYDGTKKYRTRIEDNAFIGCNTNLVAPVTVAEGAYTAAGSTITIDVPPGQLGIARERQINKDNWKKDKNIK